MSHARIPSDAVGRVAGASHPQLARGVAIQQPALQHTALDHHGAPRRHALVIEGGRTKQTGQSTVIEMVTISEASFWPSFPARKDAWRQTESPLTASKTWPSSYRGHGIEDHRHPLVAILRAPRRRSARPRPGAPPRTGVQPAWLRADEYQKSRSMASPFAPRATHEWNNRWSDKRPGTHENWRTRVHWCTRQTTRPRNW